ncbi:Uncharacterised protein [Candidatus Bilamarchaeum dharawalense]|uniref:Uncharacterized protein n=1 Tax=Candidatus Bilamarchaeum dharawalense TaxID=2885759 RepID=A0A5E4LPP4_9ARCH|nr:Uncharacterised protein [Candidatus Bilamarchaeum dharawalense]
MGELTIRYRPKCIDPAVLARSFRALYLKPNVVPPSKLEEYQKTIAAALYDLNKTRRQQAVEDLPRDAEVLAYVIENSHFNDSVKATLRKLIGMVDTIDNTKILYGIAQLGISDEDRTIIANRLGALEIEDWMSGFVIANSMDKGIITRVILRLSDNFEALAEIVDNMFVLSRFIETEFLTLAKNLALEILTRNIDNIESPQILVIIADHAEDEAKAKAVAKIKLEPETEEIDLFAPIEDIRVLSCMVRNREHDDQWKNAVRKLSLRLDELTPADLVLVAIYSEDAQARGRVLDFFAKPMNFDADLVVDIMAFTEYEDTRAGATRISAAGNRATERTTTPATIPEVVFEDLESPLLVKLKALEEPADAQERSRVIEELWMELPEMDGSSLITVVKHCEDRGIQNLALNYVPAKLKELSRMELEFVVINHPDIEPRQEALNLLIKMNWVQDNLQRIYTYSTDPTVRAKAMQAII